MSDENVRAVIDELGEFAAEPNAFRSVLILIFSLIVAYWLSSYIARIIVFAARLTARESDKETNEARKLRLRRLETHLSVTVAVVRALTVGVVAFYVWQIVSPAANLSTAAIGASAFFIVIASATLGMLLRDITSGSAMIIERWFDVGDFIQVEPFLDVNGVVERITLRSTKIRNLNGEVIWLHNQHIQGVKVTPGGLRTIAVDLVVNNEERGVSLIERVVAAMPTGPLTVTESPKIVRKEKWGEKLWLITVTGNTPPGREWLMEDYFTESVMSIDERRKANKTLVRKPIVRYADPAAERSFKRAVRAVRAKK